MPRSHDGNRPKGMTQGHEGVRSHRGSTDPKTEKPIDTSVLNDPHLTEIMEVAEREADRYETPSARVMAYQNGVLAGIGTHVARLRADTQMVGDKVGGVIVTFGLVTALLLSAILWRIW